MYKLGEHIRYYRQQLGWTQQQLADRLRVSRPVLSRWETGQLTPDLFQAAALRDIFDV
jgi:transcriptional regulator with XRE-family HTH domain